MPPNGDDRNMLVDTYYLLEHPSYSLLENILLPLDVVKLNNMVNTEQHENEWLHFKQELSHSPSHKRNIDDEDEDWKPNFNEGSDEEEEEKPSLSDRFLSIMSEVLPSSSSDIGT